MRGKKIGTQIFFHLKYYIEFNCIAILNYTECHTECKAAFKVGLAPSKNIICFYLSEWKPFKNDEKCFLFRLKNSFCSQVFKSLSRLFGHVEKRFC